MENGNVVRGIEADRVRRELGGRAEWIDHCVVLAGDDVRRRDDDSWGGDPARASMPSPHAVPRIRTTLGAAARTPGTRRTCGFGGGTCASGPPSAGNGSNRASA